MLDTLSPHTADTIRAVVDQWRLDTNRPGKGYCYVADRYGIFEAFRWTPSLLPATDFDVGIIAVDIEENIFVVEGGTLKWRLVAQTVLQAPPTEAPLTSYPVTGGPVRAEVAAEMSIITQKLHASGEVQEVLSLSWLTDEERWLYLVKCPASWAYPKFVMGKVDAHFGRPEPLYRFGAESSARTEWDKQNIGDHP